jgi:integrase
VAKLRKDKGRLFIDFVFRAERCRESLHLSDTRENRKKVDALCKKLEAELALNTFDYASYFPRSKRLEHFGLVPKMELPTVGVYAQAWLEARRPTLKPATAHDYKLILSTHILPSALAIKRIDQVRPGDIRAFVAELDAKRTAVDEKKLGSRRINMARDRLFTMLREAHEDGLIADNPVRHVKRLEEPTPEVDPLTFDEVQRILQIARGQERSLFTVLLLSGMRPGEVLALRWDDIDSERNEIRVRKTLSRYGLGTPKTKGSKREVEMHAPVRAALMEQRTRTMLAGGYVFVSERGGPLDETNVRERSWRRLLRRAGLPYRPLYHCRHTYATLELENGENPLFVARQLGHRTPETTFRRYARFMKRVARTGQLAERLATAELGQKRAAAASVGARRQPENIRYSAERIGGAGDRGRTGDVQPGEQFIHDVYQTLSTGKDWEQTLLLKQAPQAPWVGAEQQIGLGRYDVPRAREDLSVELGPASIERAQRRRASFYRAEARP